MLLRSSDIILLGDGEDLPEPFSEARNMMYWVFKRALGLLKEDEEERAGGYLSVAIPSLFPRVFRMPFGEMRFDKSGRYSELCMEKWLRLRRSEFSIWTSFETRNPNASIVLSTGEYSDLGEWGGATRATSTGATYLGDFLSFSGLPELWDEAVVFVLAIALGWLDRGFVLERISEDRNSHLRRLLTVCNLPE